MSGAGWDGLSIVGKRRFLAMGRAGFRAPWRVSGIHCLTVAARWG